MAPSWRDRLAGGTIVPHFQPILSLETQQVVAYEALGRLETPTGVESLGPFLQGRGTEPGLADLRKTVDRSLRQSALARFAAAGGSDQSLFLNVNPRLMAEHLATNPGELPWTLKVIRDLGIDPSRVVIELTEESITGQTGGLRELVDLYRAQGCRIAIDDLGSESSNLDRIGHFEPDIVKIDAEMLRRSLGNRSFHEVLRGVGAMAEGLGAALLFEGVETEEDLLQSLSFGARYVQGWYFAKASDRFVRASDLGVPLRSILARWGRERTAQDEATRQRIRETMETLGRPPTPLQAPDGTWGFAPGDLDYWGWPAFRVFLTDKAGFQVSGNYEISGTGWAEDPSKKGWSRAMRPYFPGGGDARWSVSPVYYDVNDRSPMRTYSRPVGPDLLLFVDVLEIENRVPKG
jgi:EAL domain-containing protein (putative c-di-GMP-specific phosphodiesterase class I)